MKFRIILVLTALVSMTLSRAELPGADVNGVTDEKFFGGIRLGMTIDAVVARYKSIAKAVYASIVERHPDKSSSILELTRCHSGGSMFSFGLRIARSFPFYIGSWVMVKPSLSVRRPT